MSSILEEKLREAACLGDTEATLSLLSQNIDVNSKNSVNGWTALHWAAKRGNEQIVTILLNHGADLRVENNKGEIPFQVCTNPLVASYLNISRNNSGAVSEFVPNIPPQNNSSVITPHYLRNPPLNGHVELGKIRGGKHTDFSTMPTTALPAAQNDELIVNVRVVGGDPDFIEIEIPRWKLTYLYLLKICCEELEINEGIVERIRKLPNTRLRKDSDVKRLTDFQCLEIVLKQPQNNDKTANCYQSISTCKNQTILY